MGGGMTMGFGAGCDGGSGNSRPVPFFFMVPPPAEMAAATGIVMQVVALGLPVSAAAAVVQIGPATIGYVGCSASGPCDCLLLISKFCVIVSKRRVGLSLFYMSNCRWLQPFLCDAGFFPFPR